MEALIVMVLALGAMAAGGFEMWLAMREDPRRFWLAWAAWTPLAMLALAAFTWSEGPGAAIGLAVVAGPLAYPCFRAYGWLDGLQYRQADEDAKDRERLKYRGVDFGGPAAKPVPSGVPLSSTPTTAAVMAQPMTPGPAVSVLSRATTERRSMLAKGLEGLVIALAAFVCVGAFVGKFAWDAQETRRARAYDIEAVASTLEQTGYAAPRVQPYGLIEGCAGYGYRWRAAGAAGRACVDYDGVKAWVEQRWPPMRPSPPPTRP